MATKQLTLAAIQFPLVSFTYSSISGQLGQQTGKFFCEKILKNNKAVFLALKILLCIYFNTPHSKSYYQSKLNFQQSQSMENCKLNTRDVLSYGLGMRQGMEEVRSKIGEKIRQDK